MARVRTLLLGLSLFACTREYHPEYHPETALTYSQDFSYATTVESDGRVPQQIPAPATRAPIDPSRVLILQSSHLDRPTDVVGVIDAHLAVGSEEAAVAAVRQQAAQMGADAVLGMQLERGPAPGDPIHVSGTAVRFRS